MMIPSLCWELFSGRSESSVRRRAQPQFVRTPSRRYTRRAAEGAQDGNKKERMKLMFVIISSLPHDDNGKSLMQIIIMI
jgi:hypothetical protein